MRYAFMVYSWNWGLKLQDTRKNVWRPIYVFSKMVLDFYPLLFCTKDTSKNSHSWIEACLMYPVGWITKLLKYRSRKMKKLNYIDFIDTVEAVSQSTFIAFVVMHSSHLFNTTLDKIKRVQSCYQRVLVAAQNIWLFSRISCSL